MRTTAVTLFLGLILSLAVIYYFELESAGAITLVVLLSESVMALFVLLFNKLTHKNGDL